MKRNMQVNAMAVGIALAAGWTWGQTLSVTTDTTATDTQTYTAVEIKNGARLTLDGAQWGVGTGDFYVGLSGASGSAGHLLITNGAVLNYTGAKLYVRSPSAATTSTLAVAQATLQSAVNFSAGDIGAGVIDIGTNAVLNAGFTVQNGKGFIRDGAQVILANQAVRTVQDLANGNADLVISGPGTRVLLGTANANASLAIARKGFSRAWITRGAVVTNHTTYVGSASYATPVVMGNTTGMLTVAEGGQLYAQTYLYVGSEGKASIKDPGGVGRLTVTDPGTQVQCVTLVIKGTNETYRSQARVASQAVCRVTSSLQVGNALLELASGGVLDIVGSQVTILPDSCGVISNVGGVFQIASYLPSFLINQYGQSGRLVTRDGTIGFRGRNEANVYDNQQNKLLAMVFEGENSFQLDNAKNTSIGTTNQSYRFDTGLGPRNYTRLILKNGSTYQGGTVTIGPGGRMEIGAGTNTLSSVCTNLGVATLQGGTAAFTAGLRNFGRLEGEGRITGATTHDSGAVLAPGGTSGIGTLTFVNANQLAGGVTLDCEIDGADVHDALAIEPGGSLALAGATLTVTPGFRPETDDTWTLIDNDGGTVSGTFAESRVWTEYAGQPIRFDVLYNAGDGDDVVLRCYRPTPTVILVR